MSTPLRIALLGCGTVGTGVVKLLRKNAEMLARRLGSPIELAGVADRSLQPDRSIGLPSSLITRDSAGLIARPDVDIVVELFGGIEPARKLILQALAAGKDVVTANKALLAEHGEELFRAAAKAGMAIGFEASVGGGVPIIRTLREALAGDRQRAVYGIVNGTCNSILSTMTDQGAEFEIALKEAQSTGLAEADPTLDIEGHDAAHKLCLLVTLAFGVSLKPQQVYTEGIAKVTAADIAYARELGYVIKLLAIAKVDDNGAIEARVHPTMIPRRHVLASVSDAFNAIYIHGEALGSTMYLGQGAGQMPTATAVVADILQIARDRKSGEARPHSLGYPVSWIKRARVKPIDDVICEYYLRFMVEDKPGVLGKIASILGRNQISMASVIQQGRGESSSAPTIKTVPVVMRSHETRERNLRRALREIERRKLVKTMPAFIRIEEQL